MRSKASSNLWEQLWAVQGGRCFKCAAPMRLLKSCKNSRSFNLICRDCYTEPDITFIFYDEAAEIPVEAFNQILPNLNDRE